MGYKLKRILIYPDGVTEKQVYPKYEWKPDASRTLLYLPLESDTNDYSGNNRTCTPTSVSFTTVGGVQSAHVGTSGGIIVTPTGFIDHSTPYRTVSALVYVTSQTSSTRRNVYERAIQDKMHSGMNLRENTSDIECHGTDSAVAENSIIVNSRMHIVGTGGDGYAKIYVNGVLKDSEVIASDAYPRGNRSSSYQQNQGVLCGRNGPSSNPQSLNGNAREIIFENILWSADDVANYYNRIKAKLGF